MVELGDTAFSIGGVIHLEGKTTAQLPVRAVFSFQIVVEVNLTYLWFINVAIGIGFPPVFYFRLPDWKAWFYCTTPSVICNLFLFPWAG